MFGFAFLNICYAINQQKKNVKFNQAITEFQLN